MNSPTASPPKAPEAEAQVDPIKEANRAKFELELEFVQALANPYYLHSLAQQNILEQPAFVNYLKYLLYWKEKDYARFIQCVYPTEIRLRFGADHPSSYPHALHNLELLQHAEFRTRLKKEESLRDSLHQKQFDHWRTWYVLLLPLITYTDDLGLWTGETRLLGKVVILKHKVHNMHLFLGRRGQNLELHNNRCFLPISDNVH